MLYQFRRSITAMNDFLNRVLAMLGENPTLTPWLLLIIIFVLIAFAAGRTGKMALGNVDTILKQGEAINARLEKECARKDAIIEARDKRIADLEDDQQTTVDFVMGLRREQAALLDQKFELERMVKSLTHDYHNTLALLEIERDLNRSKDK